MANTSPPAVLIEGLTKIFRLPFRKEEVVAVDNLSLKVGAGEVYGLIGPNGSGKSTTMKVLLGLISPSAGKASISALIVRILPVADQSVFCLGILTSTSI